MLTLVECSCFFFCGCWWDVCMIMMLTLLLHLFDLLYVFFSPSVWLYQVPWPITSSQTLCCALTPLTTLITPYWANQLSITTPPSACTTLKVCCILPLLWLPNFVCVCELGKRAPLCGFKLNVAIFVFCLVQSGPNKHVISNEK